MRNIKIELEGFGCFKKSMSFDFSGKGVYTIIGRNGAGKTTAMMAMCWCLYGSLPEIREAGDKASDVVNHESDKCKVTTTLEGRNKKQYQVIRTRFARKTGERLEIIEDGVKIKPEDPQGFILEVITGVPFSLFKAAVFLSQEKAERFLGGKESQQKDIIEDIINVNLEPAYKITTARRKETESLISTTSMRLGGLSSSLSEVERHLEDLIKSRDGSVEQQQADTRELSKKRSALNKQLLNVSQERNKLQAAIDELPSRHKGLQLAEYEVNRIKATLSGMHAVADPAPLDDRCIQCAVYIDILKYKEGVQETIRVQTDILNRAVACMDSKRVSYQKELRSLQEQKTLADITYSQLCKEFNDVTTALENTQRDIAVTPYDDLIKAEQDNKNKLLQQITTTTASLELLKDNLNLWDFWSTGFGAKGIKNFMMDTIRGPLANYVNYRLGKLFPEKDICIRVPYEVDGKSGDTKFQVELFMNGKNQNYKRFCRGEKARLDLSVLLAQRSLVLANRGVDIGILFLDDIFNPIDDPTLMAQLLLEELKNTGVETIVITDPNVGESIMDDIRQFADNWLVLK